MSSGSFTWIAVVVVVEVAVDFFSEGSEVVDCPCAVVYHFVHIVELVVVGEGLVEVNAEGLLVVADGNIARYLENSILEREFFNRILDPTRAL